MEDVPLLETKYRPPTLWCKHNSSIGAEKADQAALEWSTWTVKIYPWFLKETADVIALPLSVIFRKSQLPGKLETSRQYTRKVADQ